MSDFQKFFTEGEFWQKVKNFALAAGREVIEKALWLFFAWQNPLTPAWAKGVIVSALGYFICLLDAIPDPTPVVGFADDLGALALAVTTVAVYINDEVKSKAAETLRQWFG